MLDTAYVINAPKPWMLLRTLINICCNVQSQ